MSHNIGRIIQLQPSPLGIGPDFGQSVINFAHEQAPAPGTRFLILHFINANFPASNSLEVDLGYGGEKDVFTAADGSSFWTRPIRIDSFPDQRVPIRYITDGAASGGVQLSEYGRAQRIGEGDRPETFTNCDLFLQESPYTEPTYDPFWICNPAADWNNFDCLPNGDLRKQVGQSACMIVSGHGEHLSTCSGTLIGSDLILSAGHCFSISSSASPLDSVAAASSSVVFGFQTNCNGTRPAGYAPKIFKVIDVVEFGYNINKDYIILRIKVPASGVGVLPLPMRTDLPEINEEVFAIHHPNGAVKKHSPRTTSYSRVTNSSATGISARFDVAGGSSGSGLYDRFGNVIGTLSRGQCTLSYYPTATILKDIATTPPPTTVPRDVMIVLDRSGSMSEATASGGVKIQEARDAASLFVTMIRQGEGHKVGLVSFSTSASKDFDLSDINDGNVTALVGPPPHSGGIVGGLNPNGTTTIGGGLGLAIDQFSGTTSRDEVILLLTDGMENTPPLIRDVESRLSNTRLCIVGYGNESNLNGPLLTRLAILQDGSYTVARDELGLKKFFASCFGDIFESGFIMDPEYFLPEEAERSEPIPFTVCGEESVTIVLGWDKRETSLLLDIRTPSGNSISFSNANVDAQAGFTWQFVRVNLPYEGEQDGIWTAHVFRPDGGSEFPPPRIDLRFFVNVIAKGGPVLKRLSLRKRFYTGEAINLLVRLSFATGTTPDHAQVKLTVTRPTESIGNILTQSGLRGSAQRDGDTIPSRYATLTALASETSQPLVNYVEESYDLFDDGAHGDGALEPDGIFGNLLENILQHEGNYTFHAKATFGEGCEASREVIWSVYADTGIDESNTTIETTVIRTTPDGKQIIRVKITPRDKFGNFVGPGRGDAFDLTGTAGTTVPGPTVDNGDGSYETEVEYDPASPEPPGIVINQPDKPPVVFCNPTGVGGKLSHYFWWFILLLILIIFILLFMLLID